MCYNNIPKMIMKTFILTTMLFASVSAGSFRQTKEIVDALLNLGIVLLLIMFVNVLKVV